MKSYCLKCGKDTENINPKISKTSNNRTMVLSKCAICGSKKSRFIKNQEAKGLLTVFRIEGGRAVEGGKKHPLQVFPLQLLKM